MAHRPTTDRNDAVGDLSRYFVRLETWAESKSITLEQCEAAKRKALKRFYVQNPDETVQGHPL